MAQNQLIAKRYADAAFQVAKKHNLIDQFLNDLNKFSAIFSDAVVKELSNPAISKTNLAEIINELGTKLSLNKQVIAFLELISRARRIADIKAIEQNFIKLAKVDQKIMQVDVISAGEIDDKDLKQIKSLLEKKYPKNSIELNQKIKSDILGGIILKIGSTMIDASLKRQLFVLEKEFQLAL